MTFDPGETGTRLKREVRSNEADAIQLQWRRAGNQSDVLRGGGEKLDEGESADRLYFNQRGSGVHFRCGVVVSVHLARQTAVRQHRYFCARMAYRLAALAMRMRGGHRDWARPNGRRTGHETGEQGENDEPALHTLR